MDRNAIAQARLNNLEKDLNMTGVQFNTTVSILFVGYVLMQVVCIRTLLACLGLVLTCCGRRIC